MEVLLAIVLGTLMCLLLAAGALVADRSLSARAADALSDSDDGGHLLDAHWVVHDRSGPPRRGG
jgi:hypothetical protein